MNQLTIQSFRRDMRKVERETGILIAGETACCSVTVAQCHLLMEMEMRGPSSLQDIADSLSLDKSTLSRTVESLVQAGLVERITDKDNRRKVSLSLTDTGKEKCTFINTLCNDQYEDIFSFVPEDKLPVVMEGISILAAAMVQKRKEGGPPCCGR